MFIDHIHTLSAGSFPGSTHSLSEQRSQWRRATPSVSELSLRRTRKTRAPTKHPVNWDNRIKRTQHTLPKALGRDEDWLGNGSASTKPKFQIPDQQEPTRNGVPAKVTATNGTGGSNGTGPMSVGNNSFNGVFLLLLLNVAAFVADHVLKLPAMRWLYLHHSSARWYQFVTSTFCHASWNHLSSNLFFLYIFGRLVEEEEGSVGLWATYLVTGAGANIVSWLVLPPNVMSVGASGAVFGLFAVSVITRLKFNWRKLLEVVILGQFVIERLILEAKSSMIATGMGTVMVNSQVNHVAHLAGALVGVLLMWLVSKIPEPPPPKSPSMQN